VLCAAHFNHHPLTPRLPTTNHRHLLPSSSTPLPLPVICVPHQQQDYLVDNLTATHSDHHHPLTQRPPPPPPRTTITSSCLCVLSASVVVRGRPSQATQVKRIIWRPSNSARGMWLLSLLGCASASNAMAQCVALPSSHMFSTYRWNISCSVISSCWLLGSSHF
jgi:hypothetical protein